jgi:pimeloyl-ACP methyl ester carboxylesterase
LRGWKVVTEFRRLQLADGRFLEFTDSGQSEAKVLVYLHGTPGCGHPPEHVEGPAAERGLRLVTISRAGYGTSSRHEDRSVADAATDCVAVLDSIGVERAYVAGVSGGGPHALACAALVPDRFIAALIVASIAPYDADRLDFLAGMGEANVVEFTTTLAGEQALRPLLEEQAKDFRNGTTADVIRAWNTMLADVDQAVLSGDLADDFMDSVNHSLSSGVDGWIDDDLAFVRPWQFDVGDVRVPTTLWHGRQDLMVPFSHGRWLAEHIPGARVNLDPAEGHMSLRVARMPEMLGELASLA